MAMFTVNPSISIRRRGAGGSELDCELSPFDASERHPVRLPAFLEQDLAVFNAGDSSGERRLAVERLARHELGQSAHKPPVVRLVPERSVEPGRRNFERVVLPERRLTQFLFFDVEDRAQILADTLAILNAHRVFRRFRHAAIGLIDDHPQDRPDRLAPELDVEDFEPVSSRHALGDGAYSRKLL
ncbi:MAG TPA: hypothetical protein VHI99_30500 [Vicinamibacterales bacterium]|nr:hypothetical protein [Vicinamibacterales bacterium]